MTAREKFQKGQRVRLTEDAMRRGLQRGNSRGKPVREGTVTGFGNDAPELVRVRPDTYQTPKRYHMDFWEPIREVG